MKDPPGPFSDRGRHNYIQLTEVMVRKQTNCAKCKFNLVPLSYMEILEHYHWCISKYCQICPACGLALRGKKYLKLHRQENHAH